MADCVGAEHPPPSVRERLLAELELALSADGGLVPRELGDAWQLLRAGVGISFTEYIERVPNRIVQDVILIREAEANVRAEAAKT